MGLGHSSKRWVWPEEIITMQRKRRGKKSYICGPRVQGEIEDAAWKQMDYLVRRSGHYLWCQKPKALSATICSWYRSMAHYSEEMFDCSLTDGINKLPLKKLPLKKINKWLFGTFSIGWIQQMAEIVTRVVRISNALNFSMNKMVFHTSRDWTAHYDAE